MQQLKGILLFFSLVFPAVIFAQTIRIDDFSSRYYAEVHVEGGELYIKDKQTNAEVIFADISDVDINYESESGLSSNVIQRPYGDQSLIIYEDFNFDGEKDFAIKNGYYSCYGGPSFLIYINKSNGFYLDNDFTSVAQEYCGIFGVDTETETIHAMTKSGCCWHRFDTYKVEDGKLEIVQSIEEVYGIRGTPFIESYITEYKDGEEVFQVNVDVDRSEVNVQFSFDLENGSNVVLFKSHDFLYYMQTNPQGEIEFAFNREPVYGDDYQDIGGSFVYHSNASNRKELQFNTIDAGYAIYYEEVNGALSNVGIVVESNEKIYELNGLIDTVYGDMKVILEEAGNESLKNVVLFDERYDDESTSIR
ncbi:XAC2610-related protein [Nitrincola sp.]|uniref:XAC2610-related protein n=1 Tax=Nitrincola sp. TaxID=1926584 RepID=UPI003A906FE2